MSINNSDEKKTGILYGVGVGPGATDLMTLRAVNVLKSVDVIAIPRGSKSGKSVAWRIAEPAVGEVAGQERLLLTFPMSKNPRKIRPAWDEAFAEIGKRLQAGKSVAFITVGDPLIYSTYIYLHHEAQANWPEVEIQIVPGVSSISAVPAAARLPIADGQETIAILPATYDTENLDAVFRQFDTTILMKVSSVMPQIIAALEAENLLERAVYISKATTEDEKIITDLKSISNDKCDYFSMVIINKNERSGILDDKGANATAGVQ